MTIGYGALSHETLVEPCNGALNDIDLYLGLGKSVTLIIVKMNIHTPALILEHGRDLLCLAGWDGRVIDFAILLRLAEVSLDVICLS